MNKIIQGDALEVLKTLEDESVQTCVTSPPYFGLRDYGVKGQMGLEETPEAYVQGMVELFREVRRVLRDDGTLWLNLGDSYNSAGRGFEPNTLHKNRNNFINHKAKDRSVKRWGGGQNKVQGLKPKDLIGIPWRVAFALQADGWYLRQDIIWAKPNPMPESVTDRCTKAHEYIFLLSKSSKYYFDHEEIKEPASNTSGFAKQRAKGVNTWDYGRDGYNKTRIGGMSGKETFENNEKRNRRSVWTVTTKPYKGAHFATFPPDLIEPCILAGAPQDGVVLDPFMGSGTTAAVAKKHNRQYLGIELNPTYIELAQQRLKEVPVSLFNNTL